MYRYQKPQPPPQPQQQSKYNPTLVSCSSNIIEALLRQKTLENFTNCFTKIKSVAGNRIQKWNLFSKVMNKLTVRKETGYKKFVMALLVENKIRVILGKREQVQKMKANCKERVGSVIVAILSRNLNCKLKQSFLTLKGNTLLIRNRNTWKTFKLTNTIRRLEQKLLNSSMKSLKLYSFLRLSKFKQFYNLDRIFSKKRRQFLATSLSILRSKPQHPQQKPTMPSSPKTQQQPNQQNLQLIKELQQQKRTLEQQLNQIKNNSRNTLKTKESEVAKVEEEFQGLRFSFDLMGQDNEELKENLVQKERLMREYEERQINGNYQEESPKKQSAKSIPSRSFSEQQLWQNIFNNVLLYLYKAKTSQQPFSPQLFQQSLLQPLLSLSPIISLQQLSQQNQVLEQLKNSYIESLGVKIDENDTSVSHENMLGVEVLSKEKRYLYGVVDCLIKWGQPEGHGLERMKEALEKLKLREQQIVQRG